MYAITYVEALSTVYLDWLSEYIRFFLKIVFPDPENRAFNTVVNKKDSCFHLLTFFARPFTR